MSIIDISNLTFAYPGSYDNVFDGVSLRFDTSWRLGLIGRNGRGKTTLLRLLCREFDGQFGGSIVAPSRIIRFPLMLDADAMTIDGVMDALDSDVQEWQLRREMGLIGLAPDDLLYRPLGTLSGGEQTKLMLAALFAADDGFLLIDEPTNHLDMDGRAVVSDYMRTKSGFILVSHDRAFLDASVDHIVSINRADIEVQQGNYSSWKRNRDQQDAHELDRDNKLKKDVMRLETSAREKSAWADKVEASKIGSHSADRGFVGAQAARVMKRSKNILRRQETAIDEKRALLQNFEEVENLKIHPQRYPQKTLVRAKELSINYDGKAVVDSVDFDIERGDRIAIVGANGTGKSSILKLICGCDIDHGGELWRGSNLIVSYVPQNSSFLSGNVKDYAVACDVDGVLFLAILRKLGFERVQFEKDMSDYSAGQKKKVLLARSLCEQAHLYVWDEPLNYIDLPSREQIEDLIVAFEPTLLIVEHDRAFVDAVATAVIEL